MTALFYAYFLFCIAIMLIFYVALFIFFNEKFEMIKKKLFVIIPLYCVLCWAGYYIVAGHFFLVPNYDFLNYYYCGKRFLKRPRDLYDDTDEYGYRYGYKYLPNFAMLIGVPLSLFPTIEMAYYFFYVINILLGLIFTLLFNRFLRLLDVKEGILRFLFLMVISNGWIVLQLYANNQVKYMVGVIILYIINRELKYNKHQIKKDFKFYFINLNLFVFVIGLAQYFIFLLLIYLFHNISMKELVKWENIKKYITIFVSFIAQNILFVIYPILLFDFYEIYEKEQRRNGLKLKLFYLEYFYDNGLYIPSVYKEGISIVLSIILYIIVLILILHRRINLVKKYGYFCIAFLYLNYIAFRILLNLIPFVCILFIPHMNQSKRGIEFIKENIIVLIGLMSIVGLYFVPHKEAFSYPYFEGIILGHLIFIIILAGCFLTLYLRKRKSQRIESQENI